MTVALALVAFHRTVALVAVARRIVALCQLLHGDERYAFVSARQRSGMIRATWDSAQLRYFPIYLTTYTPFRLAPSFGGQPPVSQFLDTLSFVVFLKLGSVLVSFPFSR